MIQHEMIAAPVPDKPFRVEVLIQYGGQSWEQYGPGVRFRSAKEAWEEIDHKVMAWGNVLDARIVRDGDPIPWAVYTCSGCAPYMAGGLMPSHRGSERCESGSLASGGKRTHCTCDVCF